MTSKRISYPPEYRQQIVEVYRAGRKFSELAREFEPSEQTIRTWVEQADLDAGRRTDGLTTQERDELRRLLTIALSVVTCSAGVDLQS